MIMIGENRNSQFNVLLTVHHAMILGNCPTWRTNSFQYIYLQFSTISRIDTIRFSWWWAWHARNMYRTINKYIERNLCVKLDNYQEILKNKSSPLSLCLAQISHGVTLEWTLISVLKGRQITARDVRPISSRIGKNKWSLIFTNHIRLLETGTEAQKQI